MKHLNVKKFMAIAALSLAGAFTASADSIWTYQGNEMAPCGCSLSGSMTLDSQNNLLSYSFTDGSYSLNSSDSFMQNFMFIPLMLGPGDYGPWWKLQIIGPDDLFFFTQFYGSQFESSDASANGFEQGNRGLWTDPVATPESGTLLLLGVGLAALALKRLA